MMVDDAQLATTEIVTSCRIAPLKNIVGDVSGILSRYNSELVGAFYPRKVSRKVEAVVTELVDNVIRNFIDGESGVSVDMRISHTLLTVTVSSVATQEQFDKVKSMIDSYNSTEDVKSLLRQTIKRRRENHQRGGLGLLRLVAENRFDLDATFNQSILAVESRIALGGLL